MMIFLNPLEMLIPKIPISFFAEFWVRVTSGARGSVSAGFWGARQLSPFWGRGGSSQRALSNPPPPRKQKPGCPCLGVRLCLCFCLSLSLCRCLWPWPASASVYACVPPCASASAFASPRAACAPASRLRSACACPSDSAFCGQVTNEVSLTTTQCSPPVLVDRTPPRFIHGPVYSAIIGHPKVWFSGPVVNVTWQCWDDESGVGYQELCVGTDPIYFPENVRPCEGVGNRSGTHQFTADWQESQVWARGCGSVVSTVSVAPQTCAPTSAHARTHAFTHPPERPPARAHAGSVMWSVWPGAKSSFRVSQGDL